MPIWLAGESYPVPSVSAQHAIQNIHIAGMDAEAIVHHREMTDAFVQKTMGRSHPVRRVHGLHEIRDDPVDLFLPVDLPFFLVRQWRIHWCRLCSMTLEWLAEALHEVLASLDPAAVYVFGSVAAGRSRPDSDLDLAVLSRREISCDELNEAKLALEERFSKDVDLIDLEGASTVLRKEILAGGRLLYETDKTRRETFEMYAFSDYARLNEERSPVLAAMGQPLDHA